MTLPPPAIKYTMNNCYRKNNDGQFHLSGSTRTISPQEVIDQLLHRLTPQRRQKLLTVVAGRCKHFIGIMENIYDQGNVHAVIRSSESFGMFQLARVAGQYQKKSSRTTSGADKWVQITDFSTTTLAIQHYRARGYQIGATVLSPTSVPIGQVDFSRPTAMIFGNEKEGCGQLARERSDFHCQIPATGFTQSFNISVAAAITFYHVHCYLKKSQLQYLLTPAEQKELLAEYLLDSFAHRPQYLVSLF